MTANDLPGRARPVDRTPVVAAVIRSGGRLLLARRPEGKRHAGLWEFPGGKVGPGETVSDAFARELREELAVEVESVGAELFSFPDPGSSFTIHFHSVAIRGTPRPIEHAELRWCDPAEFADLEMAPADARFARAIDLDASSDDG